MFPLKKKSLQKCVKVFLLLPLLEKYWEQKQKNPSNNYPSLERLEMVVVE